MSLFEQTSRMTGPFGQRLEEAFPLRGRAPDVQVQRFVEDLLVWPEIRDGALSVFKQHIALNESEPVFDVAGTYVSGRNLNRMFERKYILPPSQLFHLGDFQVFVSEICLPEGSERPMCHMTIARETMEGPEFFVHTVYRSQSQNIWRVASHRLPEEFWLGKGIGELGTALPIELQPLLSMMYNSELRDGGLSEVSRDRLYAPLEEYGSYHPPERFLRSLRHDRTQIGRFEVEGVPESFVFDDPQVAPDFERVLMSFSSPNPLYEGSVHNLVFSSMDGRYLHMFCHNDKGETWVGCIQKVGSAVTRFGVNASILQIPEDYLLPGREYGEQIPRRFRGESVAWDPAYRNATSFTHRLPPVAQFRRLFVEPFHFTAYGGLPEIFGIPNDAHTRTAHGGVGPVELKPLIPLANIDPTRGASLFIGESRYSFRANLRQRQDEQNPLLDHAVEIQFGERIETAPLPVTLTVGRSDRSFFKVNDPLVSGIHAEIGFSLAEGKLVASVTDLTSSNGTQVVFHPLIG
jgi:hypothetical protein